MATKPPTRYLVTFVLYNHPDDFGVPRLLGEWACDLSICRCLAREKQGRWNMAYINIATCMKMHQHASTNQSYLDDLEKNHWKKLGLSKNAIPHFPLPLTRVLTRAGLSSARRSSFWVRRPNPWCDPRRQMEFLGKPPQGRYAPCLNLVFGSLMII